MLLGHGGLSRTLDHCALVNFKGCQKRSFIEGRFLFELAELMRDIENKNLMKLAKLGNRKIKIVRVASFLGYRYTFPASNSRIPQVFIRPSSRSGKKRNNRTHAGALRVDQHSIPSILAFEASKLTQV